jgi:hypothetical protein
VAQETKKQAEAEAEAQMIGLGVLVDFYTTSWILILRPPLGTAIVPVLALPLFLLRNEKAGGKGHSDSGYATASRNGNRSANRNENGSESKSNVSKSPPKLRRVTNRLPKASASR